VIDRGEAVQWFKQVRHALESAKVYRGAGFYDWSCFKSHQASEYALKGLLRGSAWPLLGVTLSTCGGGRRVSAEVWRSCLNTLLCSAGCISLRGAPMRGPGGAVLMSRLAAPNVS